MILPLLLAVSGCGSLSSIVGVGESATSLNSFRAANGLSQLSSDPGLTAMAQSHAADMARRESLDHNGFMEFRGPKGARAENVAYGCRIQGINRKKELEHEWSAGEGGERAEAEAQEERDAEGAAGRERVHRSSLGQIGPKSVPKRAGRLLLGPGHIELIFTIAVCNVHTNPAKPMTTRSPPMGTKPTDTVWPGGKSTCSPAGMASRMPNAAERSMRSLGFASARCRCELSPMGVDASFRIVTVTESAGRATIVVRSDRLFASGSARLEAAVEPVLLRVAAALDRRFGKQIQIVEPYARGLPMEFAGTGAELIDLLAQRGLVVAQATTSSATNRYRCPLVILVELRVAPTVCEVQVRPFRTR